MCVHACYSVCECEVCVHNVLWMPRYTCVCNTVHVVMKVYVHTCVYMHVQMNTDTNHYVLFPPSKKGLLFCTDLRSLGYSRGDIGCQGRAHLLNRRSNPEPKVPAFLTYRTTVSHGSCQYHPGLSL